MLLVVEVPPHVPHPSVIEGGSPVESPSKPCVAGELTRMRLAAIAVAKRRIRLALRV